MVHSKVLNTDYYVISDDFRLLNFNQNVKDRYKGIKCGDLCYKATMKRDTPCLHCPIAGNSQEDSATYFDPFYRDWVEAHFTEIGDGKYAVICCPANNDSRSMFQRLKKDDIPIAGSILKEYDSENIGMIGGYCEEGFPLYYVNERMIKLLGYDSREDLEKGISGKIVNTIHPDDLPQVTADLGDHYYAGMKYETTYRMPKKDGTWFWTVDRGEVIETADGRLAIVSACLDVTEQYEQHETKERELRASAARDQLLSGVTKMLYSYNMTVNVDTGKYTLITGTGMGDTVSKMQTTDNYEDIYRYFINSVDETYLKKGVELLNLDIYRGKQVKSGHLGTEEFLIHYTKQPEWHEINVFAGYDENGEAIINILGRDVTEAHDKADTKAQLEIAKAASEAKTAFLFNMSHDIRTPMNTIIGFTDLLKKHIDDKQLSLDYIGKIQTANEFLLSLINNVLEMARIESGKVIIDEAPYNVYEFWEELYSLLGTKMEEKVITFNKNIQIKHPNVIVDNTKIREILLNILSNAVKYTPYGGTVSMTLTEFPSERKGYTVYQTIIEDTGIGMSEEFLPHIFEEFMREKTSTESKVVGTGLGMPIVKKLVDLMQGKIEVESELGKGTKFTLTLTHRIANTAETNNSEQYLGEYGADDFAGKRILLAEDNELNAEIAITILEEMGFLVELAEDGIVCVNMIEKAAPDYYDLVLMDIQMPNMDGYKATQFIRRLPDNQKANIPIIAMTANAFDEDKKNAFEFGMNGHIVKPIQINMLNNTLGVILSHNEEDREIYKQWQTYFDGSKPFNQFKTEYSKQGIPCGCLVYKASGDEKIFYADDTLIHIFGCRNYMEFNKHVGGSFKTMVHPDDIERVEGEISQQFCKSEDNIDRVKYRIVRKDGAIRMIDDIGRKVFTENGSSVFYAYIVDVTDGMP